MPSISPFRWVRQDLACTGLYTDIASKRLSETVRPYKPATELMSNGVEARHWIYLPVGQQIDTRDPDNWRFPVGTKFFREASIAGHRAETQMYWKDDAQRWIKAAYHWTEDETHAERHEGGTVKVADTDHEIASARECDACHKGREDRALGFEAVSLGLPGAEGLTLAMLVEAGLLTAPPDPTRLAIGDDGTGYAA